ncbi:arginine deiminase family protein [Alphaproteobacteria bacterium]|nr:arginine deiminase family protein [Alphaproteobacteria bacterium]MDC1054458.1 arginine deiminase family protein [Alphaproteobacteria bacterium]MDC3270220.1 arginine deiminase family protein [Alphaproteobacteria bacterium]
MSYSFKNAIIRLPNKSIQNGLSSQNLHPQYEVIAEEHSNYIKAINEAGLQIKLLESLEEYPDSIFVEDPALTYKSNVIILNPFDPSRNGEKNIIKNEIKHFFDNILFVEDGFVEGGDILNINNHFIIGLSHRTNKLGADNLSKILQSLGATVEIRKTPDGILHFKSECSIIDDNTILVSNKMAQLDYLKSHYHLIELPIGEEGAANSLRINDKLLLPDGFVKAEEMLSKKYNIIKVKVDEVAKVDAGLSCMSLRY